MQACNLTMYYFCSLMCTEFKHLDRLIAHLFPSNCLIIQSDPLYYRYGILNIWEEYSRGEKNPNLITQLEILCIVVYYSLGAVVKNLPASAGDTRNAVLTPGLGRSSGAGNDNPLQYICLEIPWMEEPGRLQSLGLLRADMTEQLSKHTVKLPFL